MRLSDIIYKIKFLDPSRGCLTNQSTNFIPRFTLWLSSTFQSWRKETTVLSVGLWIPLNLRTLLNSRFYTSRSRPPWSFILEVVLTYFIWILPSGRRICTRCHLIVLLPRYVWKRFLHTSFILLLHLNFNPDQPTPLFNFHFCAFWIGSFSLLTHTVQNLFSSTVRNSPNRSSEHNNIVSVTNPSSYLIYSLHVF